MEGDARLEELVLLVESIREEVADLKKSIAKDAEEEERPGPDMAKIKSLLDAGFARVAETLRPLAEKARDKIGKPAGATVNAIEEKIAAHPFASVGLAVIAGFAVGRALGCLVSGKSGKE